MNTTTRSIFDMTSTSRAKHGTNPSNFSMSLGTARLMVANPTDCAPHNLSEARRVVAYWAKRNAKKAA